MTKIYLSPFYDPDRKFRLRYGIFFDNNGKQEPHCEKYNYATNKWIPLYYDDIDEAVEKFNSIIAESMRERNAKPFSEEEARRFVANHSTRWVFAKSYAKTVPHEYLVKYDLPYYDAMLDFERFIATMRSNYVEGFFFNKKNHYYILDDHYYWVDGHENVAINLINRGVITDLTLKNGKYYYTRGT